MQPVPRPLPSLLYPPPTQPPQSSKQPRTIVILAVRPDEERRTLERGTRRAELLDLGHAGGQRRGVLVRVRGAVGAVVHAHLGASGGWGLVVTIRKEVEGTNEWAEFDFAWRRARRLRLAARASIGRSFIAYRDVLALFVGFILASSLFTMVSVVQFNVSCDDCSTRL